MKNRTIKLILGITGIFITIIGWTISNANHLKFVEEIIAPKYGVAISTYKKMTNEGFTLKEGDKGFPEMVELFNLGRKTLVANEGSRLSEEWQAIKKINNWEITQFKTLDSRLSSVPEKLHPVKSITLEIKSSNFHTVTIPSVHSLNEGIEAYYRSNRVFKNGAYIFWSGIILSVLSLFL